MNIRKRFICWRFGSRRRIQKGSASFGTKLRRSAMIGIKPENQSALRARPEIFLLIVRTMTVRASLFLQSTRHGKSA
jgi:hypothetical protein